MDTPCRTIVLGSTGSIGTQTLEVVEHMNAARPGMFEVAGLVAGRCSETLSQQAQRFGCPVATSQSGEVIGASRHETGCEAIVDLIRREHERQPIDLIVGAIVGIAGLAPVLAAIELGIDVALANKETLVAAGELVVPMAQQTGARVLPVDSEHSALWQCLRGARQDKTMLPPTDGDASIAGLTLTASGGALRDWSRERIADATPPEALAHPTWSMGQKVTIDSASLMNKGFEVMEARWLFGVGPDDISVLVQPTSTVHSLIEFIDGTVLAQLGTPDMRTAIQYAMLRGEHAEAPGRERLDLAAVGSLEFREPDHDRFPMLKLASDALRTGGTAGATLNGANEAAVGAFLEQSNADGSRLRFGRIAELVRGAIEACPAGPLTSIDSVLTADARAREWVRSQL